MLLGVAENYHFGNEKKKSDRADHLAQILCRVMLTKFVQFWRQNWPEAEMVKKYWLRQATVVGETQVQIPVGADYFLLSFRMVN